MEQRQGHLATSGWEGRTRTADGRNRLSPVPKGGVGFHQAMKTGKAILEEEPAYKRLAGMMFSNGAWVGLHMRRPVNSNTLHQYF